MTTEPLTQPLKSTAFGQIRLAETINQVTGVVGFLSWGVAELALKAPLAASSTYYLTTQPAAGALIAVNKAADFARNIQAVAAGATTGTITVNGLDINGYAISEVITMNGTSPVTGNKAFSYVFSVLMPSTGTTVSVGIGVKFGFQNRVQTPTVFIANVDTSADSNTGTTVVASTTANTDYYGTWSPATAPNGTHNYAAYFIPTDYANAGVNN
jgi:hypothetical protein